MSYDLVRDGKFYKKTTGKGGRPLECEVVECRCGGWASAKLVDTPHHLGSTRHREWAVLHGEALVESYQKRNKTPLVPVEAPFRDPEVTTNTLVSEKDRVTPFSPDCYKDDEGLWVKLGEDSDAIPDRYFRDFKRYRDEGQGYAKVCEPHKELRCVIGNPLREKEDVFFHHSELSREGLMAVLEARDALPTTEKQCVEALLRLHYWKAALTSTWQQYSDFFDVLDEVVPSKREAYQAFMYGKRVEVAMKTCVQEWPTMAALTEVARSAGCGPSTKEECLVALIVENRVLEKIDNDEWVEQAWLS